MTLGLYATSKDNKDNPEKLPAMSDLARAKFAEALGDVLRNAVGPDLSSSWWPRYAYLPLEVRDWKTPGAVPKLAFAVGRSEEKSLVAGKALDTFIVDALTAAKASMVPLLAQGDIRPVEA